jgi:Ca2+-binding EF-hand superfamily protein
MSRLLSVGVVIALLAVAPRLALASPGRAVCGAVAGGDTNGDGVVTRDEARAAAVRLFERFDRDGDGVVTRAEAAAPPSAPSRQRFEARFAELDRDRDGALSRWESRLAPRRFARLDRDADDRLSRAELWRGVQRARSRSRASDAGAPLIRKRDLDADGRVTRAELERVAERRFGRRDHDADGRLTPSDSEQLSSRRGGARH